MVTVSTIGKAALILLAICVTATAAARRPSGQWTFYHFEGSAFVAGKPVEGLAYIAVLENCKPVVTKDTTGLKAVPLPSGKGAVAGIAYIQSSGGKLGGGAGHAPVSRLTLQAMSDGKTAATFETDENGYFTAPLPPGAYRVGSGPFYADVTVKAGITTIVPIRAGKRMVD